MVGCFNDHFVGADAVHFVEHSLGLFIQTAFDAECRELIGNDANGPPWAVFRGSTTIIAGTVGQNFGGSFTFVAGTKRAESALDFDRLAQKSVGRLARSVEIITHRPTMGSFLNSGT